MATSRGLEARDLEARDLEARDLEAAHGTYNYTAAKLARAANRAKRGPLALSSPACYRPDYCQWWVCPEGQDWCANHPVTTL